MSEASNLLKIELNTEERLETCVATLRLCATIVRDLADAPLAREIDGSMALLGFAGMLEDLIRQVLDERR